MPDLPAYCFLDYFFYKSEYVYNYNSRQIIRLFLFLCTQAFLDIV